MNFIFRIFKNVGTGLCACPFYDYVNNRAAMKSPMPIYNGMESRPYKNQNFRKH